MVNSLGHANTATYNGRALRQLDTPHLAGAVPTRPLGARSGVRPGTPTSTASATSTTWTCQPFAGIIDFVAAAEAGPYPFAFDAVQTGAVTAAAGLSRVDILYVEGNDPAESAGTPLGVSVKYLAGAADGSGNPPATPARSFRIARINMPASGGGAPTVVWDAPYTVAAGGILPVPATAYPATPHLGQYVDDAALGLMRWDGTGWRRQQPGLAPIIPTSVVGGTVSASGVVTFAGATGVSLNGVFSSLFSHYMVRIERTIASLSSSVYARLRLAGSDAAAASDYNMSVTYRDTGGVLGGTTGGQTYAQLDDLATTGKELIVLDVLDPAVADATILMTDWTKRTSATSTARGTNGGAHAPTTAYDGITIYPNSGNFSGTVQVFGYAG